MFLIVRLLAALSLSLLLASCGNLLSLREELKEAKRGFIQVSGQLDSPSCANCPTIVVAMGDKKGKEIHAYRVFERAGSFQMVTLAGSRYLFAFNDLNNDFEYQPDEPSGWYELPAAFPAGGSIANIDLQIRPLATDDSGWPAMGNLFDLRKSRAGILSVQLGQLIDLDDPRFDQDMAGLGMWQPLHFMREGYAGIYFLEPYTADKTPVLFVHGINGSPRDFAAMISRLDRRKYQPWMLYYPSGLEVNVIGEGLFGMLTALHHRYPIDDLHVVAHSMGGLLARSALAACEGGGNCDYVRSFTSISSPFDGHAAARSGIDYSPVIMPVWKSIVPGSPFLRTLFRKPMPQGLPHYLLFGYRNTSLVSFTSGDGTIPLDSQLRPEAQSQATALRGFDEDHMSILGNDSVYAYVNQILTTHDRR